MTPTSEPHVNLLDLPIPINTISCYQKDWGNHYLCSISPYRLSWDPEVSSECPQSFICYCEQPIMTSNQRASLDWRVSVMSLIQNDSFLIKYDKSDLGSPTWLFVYKWWKCFHCCEVFHLFLSEGIAGSFCIKNGSSAVLCEGWKMHVTAVSLVKTTQQGKLCQY